MLDIKFLRENPDVVKKNIENKFQNEKLPLVDEVIELDQKKRDAQQEADSLRANRNKISKEIGALMGQGKKEEAEAKFLAEIAEKVTYIKMYKDSNGVEGTFAGIKNIEVLSAVKPVGIKKNGMKVILETQAGGSYEFDGIFVMREHVAPKTLVPGLKTEENKVLVQRDMSTNIKGLFACGDITGAPYQYVKAAGEGNVAALSAVAYLAK